jgi:hypothetical protein
VLDTKGLTQAVEGHKLRVEFFDGEIALIRLVAVDVHDDCHLCPGYAGIIYDILETNQPARYEKNPQGSSYWSEFPNIEKWTLVDER